MSQNECLKAGDKAPDFELIDHNEKEVKLSDFKGKRVLLSFHPLAWTSVSSKKAWAESLNINNIRLLSDFWPHGNVAEFFGIFREKDGFSERANIIIDEDQNIEYVQIYEISKLPDIDEIITFLRSKLRKEM